MKVAQSCPLFETHGLYNPWNSLGQNTGVGKPFPSPGDLPNPGIEPRSCALQADSLPAEPQGSPRILKWVAYPFSNGSSQPRNQTGIFCIAGGFFNNWAIREDQRKYGGALKPEYRATIWFFSPTSGHISGEKPGLKVHMHPNVHCSAAYNNQEVEAT